MIFIIKHTDYISSCPSVLMPIKELIAVCKKHNVMSMVDGAHVPGQIQINLEELGADFFAGMWWNEFLRFLEEA